MSQKTAGFSVESVDQYTRKVAVHLGAGTLTVEYAPARFNRKAQRDVSARVKAAQERTKAGEMPDEDDAEGGAAMLVNLLVDWDATVGGTPAEITVPFLVDRLGYAIINQIMAAIMLDMNPNAQNGGGQPS